MAKCVVVAVCVAVALSWLAPLAQGAEAVPAGTPVVEVNARMEAPGWALKEREVLELNGRAAELWERACLLPNDYINVAYEHGGGLQAADDVLEIIYQLPLLYSMGAEEATWRAWWTWPSGTAFTCFMPTGRSAG